jgi:ABC-type sugar transport system permease subunit
MIVRKRVALSAWLFVLPALLLYLVFVVVPLLQTLQFSTTSFRGLSSVFRPVGVTNYQNLFKDPIFHQVLGNMLKFTLLGGTAVYIGGLLLAAALQSHTKWAKALRSIYLLPHILPVVAIAVLWRFVYMPKSGLLAGLGIPGPSDGFLGSADTALPALTMAWIWYALGFYAMLFSAGMQTIPDDVNQAADLDGASPWQTYTKITLPLMFSVRKMAMIYVVVHAANLFALVQVMTDGRPARSTDSLLTYLYDLAFENSRMGYASALAVVNLVLVVLAALFVNFLFRKNPVEGTR